MSVTASKLPYSNFPGATARGPISPSAGGIVYLTEAMLGNTLTQAAAIQVQSTEAFTVEVMGPIGRFELDPPYSAYPGPGPSSAVANGIVLIRGRWKALRVLTTGQVYVLIDQEFRAYGGV